MALLIHHVDPFPFIIVNSIEEKKSLDRPKLAGWSTAPHNVCACAVHVEKERNKMMMMKWCLCSIRLYFEERPSLNFVSPSIVLISFSSFALLVDNNKISSKASSSSSSSLALALALQSSSTIRTNKTTSSSSQSFGRAHTNELIICESVLFVMISHHTAPDHLIINYLI